MIVKKKFFSKKQSLESVKMSVMWSAVRFVAVILAIGKLWHVFRKFEIAE